VKLLFIHDSAEPKVCDKQISVVFWGSEEQVLWLEVSMHDSMIVEICYSRKRSSNEVGGIGFII
jgi:hypothetical protein